MAGISVTVRDLGVGAMLQSMRAQLSDMAPVYRAIGSKLERNVHIRFDTKTAPSGKPWKAWAPTTAAARKKEGRGTLLEYTDRMRDSLAFFADNSGVEVGFGVDYAKYLEPRRPMLFDNDNLSDGDLNDALSAAMQAFKKQLQTIGFENK